MDDNTQPSDLVSAGNNSQVPSDNGTGLPPLPDTDVQAPSAPPVSLPAENTDSSPTPPDAVASTPSQASNNPVNTANPSVKASPPAPLPKKLNKKLIIGGGVALLLLLVGVPLVAMGLKQFRGDVRQRASEPKVAPTLQVKNTAILPTTAPNTQAERKYAFLGNVENKAWQKMKPTDVKAEITGGNITVSWKDNLQITPRPYMWLISFWYESYNPLDAFSKYSQQDPIVRYRGEYESTLAKAGGNQRSALLDLNMLPVKPKVVYYALIKKVSYSTMDVDFVYGKGNSSSIPFSVKVN